MKPNGVLRLSTPNLDWVILTHYHGDHVGGLQELSKRIPIKHFYDHGESVEMDRPNIATFAKAYAEIVSKSVRTVVKPGDKIALADTDITVVTSAGNVLQTPIAIFGFQPYVTTGGGIYRETLGAHQQTSAWRRPAESGVRELQGAR